MAPPSKRWSPFLQPHLFPFFPPFLSVSSFLPFPTSRLLHKSLDNPRPHKQVAEERSNNLWLIPLDSNSGGGMHGGKKKVRRAISLTFQKAPLSLSFLKVRTLPQCRSNAGLFIMRCALETVTFHGSEISGRWLNLLGWRLTFSDTVMENQSSLLSPNGTNSFQLFAVKFDTCLVCELLLLPSNAPNGKGQQMATLAGSDFSYLNACHSVVRLPVRSFVRSFHGWVISFPRLSKTKRRLSDHRRR